MDKEKAKILDRSLDYAKDTRGVPYSEGNREARRYKAKNKKMKSVERKFSKKYKKPKKDWKKGESKFIDTRPQF